MKPGAGAAVRVFLVRHGRAEASHPAGDAARRLTPEGRAELEAHLGALRGDLALERIVTSPFVRTRETAAILAAATGAPVALDPDLASGRSSGAELLRTAARLGRGTALVGHNPEIAQAVALAGGRELPVPPGSVAAIDVDGGFRLAWLRAPR